MFALIQVSANIVFLVLAVYLLPGVNFTGSWWQLILAGFLIGVINLALKPVLKAIWPPFLFFSLAVFTVILNTVLLIFTGLSVDFIAIAGLWPALWAVLIMSLVNYSINTIINYQ
jgi:uncharacterized membrane protein YvlD (DUF360 family)